MKIGKFIIDEDNNIHISSRFKRNVIKYLRYLKLIENKNKKNQEILCSLNRASHIIKLSSNNNTWEFNYNDISKENVFPVRYSLNQIRDGDMFKVLVITGKDSNAKSSEIMECIKIPKYGYYNITRKEKLFKTLDDELDSTSEWRYKSGRLNYNEIKRSCTVWKDTVRSSLIM